MARLSFLSILFFFTSCIWREKVTITVDNQSSKHIDSVVIHVQTTRRVILNIKPGETAKLQIEKNAIDTSPRDITVRGAFYDQQRSKFESGFFYNDLSGAVDNEYRFTIRKDLFVEVRPVRSY